MQETALYLIRHGETDYNRAGIVQGRGVNASLNATGRRQAEAVARRLAEAPLDVLYTSPLRRAAETAQAIAAAHPGVPLHRMGDLEEMAWGVYEGAPPSEGLYEVFGRLYARWQGGDYAYRITGGESVLDVQERALRALDCILGRHPGQTVAVVTHGRFLRILLATLLPAYGLERMHEIAHANTCVNYITCRDGAFVARLLNCTAHLDEAVLSGID